MTACHVLEEVFHPEQRVAAVSHLGVFLHLSRRTGHEHGSHENRTPSELARPPDPVPSLHGLDSFRDGGESKGRAAGARPCARGSQTVKSRNLEEKTSKIPDLA